MTHPTKSDPDSHSQISPLPAIPPRDSATIRILVVDATHIAAERVMSLLEPSIPGSTNDSTAGGIHFQVQHVTAQHVTSIQQAFERLSHQCFDIALVQYGSADQNSLLEQVLDCEDALPMIVMLDEADASVAIQMIESGAQDVLVLSQTNRSSLIQSIQFAIARHRGLIRLRADAQTDPLTGLHNRRNLTSRFNLLAKRCHLNNDPMSLALFDLDHFKDINDQHGHFAGDKVLRWVGQLLSRWTLTADQGQHQNAASEDAAGKDADIDNVKELDVTQLDVTRLDVTRLGGEEFAILMPRLDLPSACQLVESVLESLASQPLSIADLCIPVSASAGVVNVLPADRWQDAYIACDALLLDAKSSGRNRCRSLRRGD